MTWVAVAVAGGSLVGGILSRNAAGDAADTQAGAANNASALTQQQYLQNRADLAPYRQAGYNGLSQLQYLMGIGNPSGYSQGKDAPMQMDGGSYGAPASAPKLVDNSESIRRAQELVNTMASRGPMFKSQLNSARDSLARLTKEQDDSKSAYDAYQKQTSSVPASGNNSWMSPAGFSDAVPLNNGPSNSLQPDQYGSLTKKFGMSDFQEDPGAQYRIDQANKALERSAAARGNLLSGGTLQGVSELNQNLASQEYGNAYNRFTNDQTTRYNRLANIAGLGQTATNTTAQLGANAASASGEYGTQSANATAAGILGQSNATTSGINSVGNALNNYNNFNQLRNALTTSNSNPQGGQLYGSQNGGTQYVF